ncbi:MAG TPA: diguanylate cyclase [Anaerolineales bacterium]|jgi:diguanylate cyclase (GGDEF)-like protein|nr:diguanylate cyclase [Anaerolineales bacterium]
MKNNMPFLQEIRFPKSFSGGEEQQEYVIRVILLASVGVLTVTSLLIFALSFFGEPFGRIWKGLLITFSLLALGLFLIRWERYQLARYLMVFSIYVFGLFHILQRGLDSVFLLFFFIALILVFMIISRRKTMIFLIIAGPPLIYFISPWVDTFHLRWALTYITFMIMSSLLLTVFTRFKEGYVIEQTRAREIEILNQAGSSILSSLDLQETIEKILEELKNLIPHDSASVMLMRDDHTLEVVGGSGLLNPEEVIGFQFQIPGDNPNTKVILEGRPYLLGNAAAVYESFRVEPHNHIQSWIGVPLVENEKIIGMLSIDSVEQDYYSEKHIDIATAFAAYVSVALDNAMLYEFANRSVLRRSILYRASKDVITASADLDKIYRAIHEAASHLMPCESFAISLVNEAEKCIDGVYLIDKGGLNERIRIPLGSGLSGKVIHSGKSVMIKDLLDEDFKGRHFGHEDEVRSLIAVPLQTGEKIIGMLSAQSYHVAAYSQEDVELLELLAAQAAVAIKNAQLLSEMARMASTDSLTGLLNRRAFDDKLNEEINRAKRYGYSLCLLMIDIDGFKQFNDLYGHRRGDQHLITVSELILNCVRKQDLVARIGGEEFCVISPHTFRDGGGELAERIRSSIEARFRNQVETGGTVSIGVAEFPLDAESINNLYDTADQAMFTAKRLGKNRVVFSNTTEHE